MYFLATRYAGAVFYNPRLVPPSIHLLASFPRPLWPSPIMMDHLAIRPHLKRSLCILFGLFSSQVLRAAALSLDLQWRSRDFLSTDLLLLSNSFAHQNCQRKCTLLLVTLWHSCIS